ncbi:MAG: hypothetical protein KAW13_01395, partial [Dehalococcoidia bacterium]|nr:hypothetical protein [Dehalococcoidia bacterium]
QEYSIATSLQQSAILVQYINDNDTSPLACFYLSLRGALVKKQSMGWWRNNEIATPSTRNSTCRLPTAPPSMKRLFSLQIPVDGRQHADRGN